MDKPQWRPDAIDYPSIAGAPDEYLKLLFDFFANQVDDSLQNELISELMSGYSGVSRLLEEKNRMLNDYNERLEELVRDKVREISAAQMATIHSLVKSAEARDDNTGAHIERTAMYCMLIAEKLYERGKYEDVVDDFFPGNIAKASPLHDIGKIGIRDSILLKPGNLTRDEFEVMKTHVRIGYETLASVAKLYPGNEFIRMGVEIAMYHQEKWDGSGYLSGLAGEAIPLSARIMAIADVYDALRSKRTYKEAYSHDKSSEIIIKGRGTHFDPDLVDVFIENRRLFADIFDGLSQSADE
ncbi:MAG: HD domain-containing protein [Clostridiales bacterium]|nr:HD domain-containing protein [Clostridiales bacterium]